ncbi:hypothetical protein Tco_0548204 [Tanacetum coccineum]
MAQLKYCDKHNQVGFLLKPTESAGYTEIVDFLRRSKLRYALTHNPPIYDSLVKQFWQTATARTLADGTQQLDATIDTIEYTITEESVRRQLQLADASGINMLQNEEIFVGLQNIGSKSGGWDQFGSNIATALICLSTGRDFNFSKLIFDGMISNLKSKSKFLMYPRFLQMILNVQTENKNLFVPVSLTKKIFGNMKRSFQGIHRPLLPVMLTIDAGQPQPSADPTPSQSVPTPSSSHVQITQTLSTPPPITQPPPTLTHSVQPPPQPSSVQPTATTPPTQPVETTSSPPISTIPDTQPTLPPSPQIPSPSYHDTEGPSFEPSYHMLESRVESLEKELSETKQTLGTEILQLMEKVKKLENKLRKKRKSKETKDAQEQEEEDEEEALATDLIHSSTINCQIRFLPEKDQKRKGAYSIEEREDKKMNSVLVDCSRGEGAKKRKLGTRRKLKAKRRKHASSLTREDDDLKICLHIAPDEDKVIDADRFFAPLWESFQFWIMEDLKVIYELVMEEYKDALGRSNDYEVLSNMLELKLETEEESSMALELIKFVKQQLEEFEDSNDDDTVTSDHEEAE